MTPRLPSWLRSPAFLASAALAAAVVGAAVLTGRRDAKNLPRPPAPSPSGAGGRASWVPLPKGAPIAARPGAIVRACIELPFYVPTSAATPARVAEYAGKRGFANVYSTSARPADWPGACEADLYVQAQWARGAESMPWPDGVSAAWELRA